MSPFTAGTLVLSGVLATLVVLLVATTAAGHLVRSRRAARTAARRADLLPVVYALLDADEDPAEAVGGAVGETAAGPPPPPGAGGSDPLLDEVLLELLPQLRGADQAALRTALTERGVVERAAAQLTSRQPWRRARAAEVLGNVAGGGHVPSLVALLTDPVAEVRTAAVRALGRTGQAAAVAPLLAGLQARPALPPGVVGMALLDVGTPALPALREAVHGPVVPASALAADLLGLHNDVGALGALLPVLTDPGLDPDADAGAGTALRVSAATALGRIGAPQATTALAAVLSGPGPLDLRVAAAAALGRIGDPAACDALLVGMYARERALAVTCAEALAGLGGAGRAQLDDHASSLGPAGAAARAALETFTVRAPRRARTAAAMP